MAAEIPAVSDSEMALGHESEEVFFAPESGQGTRKRISVAFLMIGLAGVMAVSVGIAKGTFSKSTSAAPLDRMAPIAEGKFQVAPHYTIHADSSSSSPSSSFFGSAPIGTMHVGATPRSLTVAEFLQTSKVSHKIADVTTRLKDRNLDPSKPIYPSPEIQIQSHAASEDSINSWLSKLAVSHPRIAMILHDLRLDHEQQEVFHNSLDHFTSEKTIALGRDVLECATGSTFQGKDDFKKKLQQKLGKGLQPLYQLKSEVFPKGFDPEQKSSVKLLDSEKTGGDAGEARFRIITAERHFSKSGRRLNELTDFMIPVLAQSVARVLAIVIPGKLGAIIAEAVADVDTIYECVKIKWDKSAWMGCVAAAVGAAIDCTEIFTGKDEGEWPGK